MNIKDLCIIINNPLTAEKSNGYVNVANIVISFLGLCNCL